MTSPDYLTLPTQTQLVSRIRHLIGLSPSFIVLSGANGSGRSVVCQQLINQLDADISVSYVELQPEMSLSQVREAVVLQLVPNAVFDATTSLNETLNRLMTDLTQPRLLIVDNADSLAADWAFEFWQWLVSVDELYSSHKISVLLIGSSEFSEYLAHHLKGREQQVLEIEIETLTSKEQKKLLGNYLQHSEISAAQTAQVLARLAHIKGKPGEVVAIAEACMDKKSTSLSGKTSLPTNKIIAAVAILAGVVLLLSWIIPSLSKNDTAVKQPERQEVAIAPPVASAALSTTTANQPEGVVSNTGVSSPTAPIAQDGVVSSGETVKGVDAEIAADDSNKRHVVINDQALQQINANQPAEEQSAVISPSEKTAVVSSVNELKPIAKDIKGESQVVLRSEPINHKISSPKKVRVEKKITAEKRTVTEKKTEIKKANVSTEHKISPKSVVAKSVVTSNNVAVGQGYALQLAASSDSVALKKLAATNGLQAKSKIYKNQSTGKYVLVYGEFVSSSAAKAAVAHLPASLKNTQPWPKSYTQIRIEQGK